MSLQEELDAAEMLLRAASQGAGAQPSSSNSAMLIANSQTALRIGQRLVDIVKGLLDTGPVVPRAPEIAADLIAVVHLAAQVAVSSNAVAALLGVSVTGAGTACATPQDTVATGESMCSFCGKSQKDTKLVSGPRSFICGSCALLACRILGLVPGEEGKKKGGA